MKDMKHTKGLPKTKRIVQEQNLINCLKPVVKTTGFSINFCFIAVKNLV